LGQVIEKLKEVIEKKRFASEDELEEIISTVMRGG
jgi:predicted Ser/Thr protein kinase